MSIVTITSDYGLGGIYQAILKGSLYTAFPSVNINDITHAIRSHDILQASFVLKQSAYYFPSGTVHLICVDHDYRRKTLVALNNGHYFIGNDNGIFSLLFNKDEDTVFYELKSNPETIDASFPEKTLYPMLVKAIFEKQLHEIVQPATPQITKQNQIPVWEENTIRGSVIYIDGYDNAITNINRQLFEERLVGKSSFAIYFRRKLKIDKISSAYVDSKMGSELAFFNSMNLLEIAMNAGNAGQLLGLNVGSPVIIEYYD